jgi:hypothetical protein
MAAIDYPALAALATGLIADFGRAATLTVDGGADIAVTVALIDYGRAERDGAMINVDDRRAFISADAGVMPDPELHELVLDGQSFRIVSTRAVKPGATILYYDCQVRA